MSHSSVRPLLRECALTALIGAQPPVHADGGGTFSLYDADRIGYLDRQEFDTLQADGDLAAAFASPPCLLHEVDPAYSGLAATARQEDRPSIRAHLSHPRRQD